MTQVVGLFSKHEGAETAAEQVKRDGRVQQSLSQSLTAAVKREAKKGTLLRVPREVGSE